MRLFVRGDPDAPAPPGPFDDPQSRPPTRPLDQEQVRRNAREALAAATPTVRPTLPTVEGTNPELALALLEVQRYPTAARHRAVAAAYRRVGILDKAHAHFTSATKLDPADAASWDAIARIWRDWGFPNLGLADVQRAVYFAPDSAEAHNTLGTILYVLGQRDASRQAFERTVALAPEATWARQNLCRVLAEQGDEGARFGCRPGVAPGSAARGPIGRSDR